PPQLPDARCGRLAPMQAEIATPRRATEPEERLEVASRVVEDARPSEQVEAVVTWSRDTEVRAQGGEVEHFVSSESAGVGVRVIADGRQCMACEGVLDDVALRECLPEARENAAFGTVDPPAGLAEPDRV